MFMTTLCLSSTCLQAAAQYSYKLLPNSLAPMPPHPTDSPAQKQLSPKDASRNSSSPGPKAIRAHAGCEPTNPSHSLWLLPRILVACAAGQAIGLPNVVSNLPKSRFRAEHSCALLQLTVDHTSFIYDMNHSVPIQFRHYEHRIAWMGCARWLQAHVDALLSHMGQLVAPHFAGGEAASGADVDRFWALRRHMQRNRNQSHPDFYQDKKTHVQQKLSQLHCRMNLLTQLFSHPCLKTYLQNLLNLFAAKTHSMLKCAHAQMPPCPHAHSKAPQHHICHHFCACTWQSEKHKHLPETRQRIQYTSA